MDGTSTMFVKLRVPSKSNEGAALPEVPVPPHGKLTVILKATDVCNIACTFCSVGPAGKNRLSDEDFELLATELERTAKNFQLSSLELTFHGGEPTAMGADWIDRACVRLKQLPLEVVFSMQTNLISFSDKMIEVVKRHGISLGSSIDPIFGERVDVRGEDTFARWVDNYKRISAAGVHVGAIFIVTKDAYTRGRDVYRVCEELNAVADHPFGLQVQPVYPQGRARDDEHLLLSPEELGRFFVDIYDEWERRGRSIGLSPLDSFAHNLDAGNPRTGLQCTFGPGCATSHCGIDYQLNVAGCGRRLDSRGIFGNLHHGHLDEILVSSVEKRKLAQRSRQLRETECHKCRFFQVCHGGCPDDADLHYEDVSRKYYWCQGYYMLYSAIEERLAQKQPPAPQRSAATSRPARGPAIVIADTVRDLLRKADHDGPVERWLLPAGPGLAPDFANESYRILETEASLFRLFVPNDRVRELRSCLDVVRDPRVRIVLYEGNERLSTALNLVNSFGTHVILDVQHLCRTAAGLQQVNAALDRYLGDPLWKVQIAPFAEMIRAGLDGGPVVWLNRWGIPPGILRALIPEGFEGTGSEYARDVAGSLRSQAGLAPGAAQQARRACEACEHRLLCRSQLAPGNGQTCSPGELTLVSRLAVATSRIIADLKRIGDEQRAAQGPSAAAE